MIRFQLELPRGQQALQGFRYFWLKRVRAFNPEHHCAKCLVGDYVQDWSARLTAGVHIVAARPAEVLYLCGVSAPFKYEANVHAPMVEDARGTFTVGLGHGQLLHVLGARLLPFTADKALEQYPGKGRAYLTCRNFQFGAHHFA